jgi:hypothetical protein
MNMEDADPWRQYEEHQHEEWAGIQKWIAEYEHFEKGPIMGRFAKESGGSDFIQAPVGSHVARCYKLTDLGTQTSEYQGKVVMKNQVLMTWELPLEMMAAGDDGVEKPFSISKFYTNSLHEKANMRHDLEAWRGRAFTEEDLDGFDLMSVLGKPCMLSIVAKPSGGTKVGSVSALPKGVQVPPQFNMEESFWLEEFSQAGFDALPKGIQKIIEKSPEWRGLGRDQEQEWADAGDEVLF